MERLRRQREETHCHGGRRGEAAAAMEDGEEKLRAAVDDCDEKLRAAMEDSEEKLPTAVKDGEELQVPMDFVPVDFSVSRGGS